ncbi:beta-lactamase family protein [Salinibacterium sp. SYSU T00001]|uniref:serine hydrolase domain-containing protein n=1 Tax=Homoserinimonas sedimenticola TaxID=2986805 RepID=UPI002236979F|nr:serine hydrolase domain-containing protein [Salinibacterium sedimenticola]MCW4386076.1 beta-lactamase family protein [Salinibacterium sedimenticola]
MSDIAPTSKAVVHGDNDPRFDPVREEFERRLESGEELGASISATIDGEPVIDLWGGWADEARSTEWERDTITNVWSTTKTVTALAVLMLVDRGEVDLEAPVARYWPEFAQNGKADITVAQVMSHTSGVSGWAPPFVTEDMFDHARAAAALAVQEPWWEPGTASGYHLLNYGHLLGEIVRRVTGKSLGAFVRDEIARPLGADFHIGLAPSDAKRVSPVVPPPPAQLDLSQLPPEHPAVRTFVAPVLDATATWSDEWRRAEIGAAGGHGNARSVARIQSVITNGGEVDGVRLLSPETIERIFEERSNGLDLVLFQHLRFGIGYALPSPGQPAIPQRDRLAYWGGWGGSLIVNDVGRGATFAYVMNRMSAGIIGSPRSDAYLAAFDAALGEG